MNSIANILERIEKVKPFSKDITLIAVTKNRTPEEILPLWNHGVTIIGENRIQEAELKFPSLDSFTFEKHLIGSLQSNKENKALELFDTIQSIESIKQLHRLIKKITKQQLSTGLFIQCNTSQESSKHGVQSEDELYPMIELLLENSHINFRGLMTIGALSDQESLVRNSFAKLQKIKNNILTKYSDIKSLTLSMGMSNDFEWAIQEGADMIRLGTILFEKN